MNKIKNEQKLFMTRKQWLHMQNQDLINTYNTLTYENKYLNNLVTVYDETLEDEDKQYILSKPINAKKFSRNFISSTNERACRIGRDSTERDWMNETLGGRENEARSEEEEKLRTPFENYIKNKESKVRELKNRVEEGELRTQAGQAGFKVSLNQLTKSKSAGMKRIKTVPCMEMKLEK